MNRLFDRSKNITLSILAALAAVTVQGCKQDESHVTELNLQSETLEVAPEGGIATMTYTINNPVEGAAVEALSSSEWLHDFDCSTDNEINFTVDENPEVGQTRTAKVVVSYNNGAIEKEFSVIQGEGVEKAPFDIDITEIGLDYAIATITPLDQEMTWHALTYECWVLDERFETIDDAIADFLNAYQFVASMSGLDFETFMSTQILVTGTRTMTFDQLGVDTDHYIFAVGLTPDGTRISDGVKKPFRTKSIEMKDITFNISIDVNGPDVKLNTAPSDNNTRYYTDVKLKSDWPDGPDIQAWIHSQIWRGSVVGKSQEEVIEELSSYGETSKEYYLNANTEYYAFAVAINDDGIICSDAEVTEFKSGNIQMSDNTFEIEINETGTDYISFDIIPSNNDTYAYAVSPAAEWEGMSDNEYVDQYISNNVFYLDLCATTGKNSYTETNLTSNTEYYLFVFGYEQATRTTDITKILFKTTLADNPEELTFEFNINNITSSSIDVKVTGTPEQALYYWDVIDASATQEETKATLDARVQRWIDIGYKADRAEVFQEMAVRGTVEKTVSNYNFGYNAIEPGKEYKLYAVGIYDETGEYATEFYFSEPFTTPLQ